MSFVSIFNHPRRERTEGSPDSRRLSEPAKIAPVIAQPANQHERKHFLPHVYTRLRAQAAERERVTGNRSKL